LNAITDHVYIIIPLQDQTCSVCSLTMGSECVWGIGEGSTFQYFIPSMYPQNDYMN